MRFWFAPHSDVPLYRQLVTQVQLAILSGDLREGDRLPSTRELARRFAIHPNTVSAGYRELERSGWTELRPGSGVYVTRRSNPTPTDETRLDHLLAQFLRDLRQAGLSLPAAHARLTAWLAAPPPNHWLLLEPDPDLANILLTEIRALTPADVRTLAPSALTPTNLLGAAPCCRPSQSPYIRTLLPAGVELTELPITSATKWLLPWLPAPQQHLIAVLSHWPEFLTTARTFLAAAGIPADVLLFRNAHQPHWSRGLPEVSGILCDAFTAQILPLPQGPQVVVFPLLAADEARNTLQLPHL